MTFAALAFIILGGGCAALQSPTNTELSRHIGNFQASTVSFAGGTLILALLTVFLGSGDLSNIADAQPWQVLGGFYGAFIVLMITYAVPRLGIALTLTLNMFGLLIMGVLIDAFGLFMMPAVSISGFRILGCIIAGAGILCVYFGKKGGKTDKKNRDLFIAFLVFLSGAGGAIQSPTNASLALITGKLEASLVSFTGGFIVLLIATLITTRGRILIEVKKGLKPWMFTGGCYGAFGVFVNLFFLPYLGVSLAVTSSMLGQLAGSIIVDSTGLLRTPKVKMNRFRYAGVLLIAIGVIIVTYSKVI